MRSNRQDVKLIINSDACIAISKTENKSLIEARLNEAVSLSSVPRVHIHADCVQLLKTSHSIKHHDDEAATLYCLHGPAEDVRSYAFKVLQYAHAESLPQYLVRVLIEAIPDVLRRQEQLDLINFFLVEVSLSLLLLDLLQTLLFVTGKLELLLVAPEEARLGLGPSLG